MNHSPFRLLLLPLSWLYGLIVGIRNILFNLEILPSRSFDVPVISIGNITVGGTGKTPHTEYLINALSKDFQLAVLSRGYKRQTKGFVLATEQSTVTEIGDESVQIKRKFPFVTVAVDENRCRGIDQLLELKDSPFIDVVLLDDAFQHRYVSPCISILLIDHSRLIKEDYLLPAGELRESASEMRRAQIVIVTKCPIDLNPMALRIIGSKIGILPYQSLFYTSQVLGSLQPLFPNTDATTQAENEKIESTFVPKDLEELQQKQTPLLIVTGIAKPANFESAIKAYSNNVKSLFFADHHEFNKRDVRKIKFEFEKIKSSGGIILTTEKDATRIRKNAWMTDLYPYIFYPTLEIKFLGGEEMTFLHKITDYVKINRRNRTVS